MKWVILVPNYKHPFCSEVSKLTLSCMRSPVYYAHKYLSSCDRLLQAYFNSFHLTEALSKCIFLILNYSTSFTYFYLPHIFLKLTQSPLCLIILGWFLKFYLFLFCSSLIPLTAPISCLFGYSFPMPFSLAPFWSPLSVPSPVLSSFHLIFFFSLSKIFPDPVLIFVLFRIPSLYFSMFSFYYPTDQEPFLLLFSRYCYHCPTVC